RRRPRAPSRAGERAIPPRPGSASGRRGPRPAACRSPSCPDARSEVPVPLRFEGRDETRTVVDRVRTALAKAAAVRETEEVGDLPGDRLEPVVTSAHAGNRAKEGSRVGMQRTIEDVEHGSVLDDATRVHDRDLVRLLRDDA